MCITFVCNIDYKDNDGNVFLHSELLPCPFCGGFPRILFIGNNRTRIRRVEIKCSKCRTKRIDAGINRLHEDVAKTWINHWNDRV